MKINQISQIKPIVLSFVVVIILIGVSSLFSYTKFKVVNPFSTATGLIRVMFTNTDYVEIQQNPKVIIAKPTTSLDTYMKNEGDYKKIEEEQLGALSLFSNGDHSEYIRYSVNKHFAKWIWQE